MIKQHFISVSEAEKAAKKLALVVRGGEIFALIGKLGSGKTTFVQFFAKALNAKKNITSPTFTIIQSFPGKLKGSRQKQKLTIYHLDLYRISNFKELSALGINEIWGNKNTITFIEWADKIKRYLPKKTTYFYFK